MTPETLTDSLRETLAVFDGVDPDTPQTTTEVADRLDLGRRSTYERLKRLVDQGYLETKKVGARGRVWWRPSAAMSGGDGGSWDGLTRLINNVPDMVYRCRNEPGRPMSLVSEAASTITGYDPEMIESGEVSYRTDIVHPDDRAPSREAVDAQLDEGSQFTVEYRIRTADGETRWLRDRGCAVEAGASSPVIEGVITDVTDEKQSEQRRAERGRQEHLRPERTEYEETQRRYETLLTAVPDAVYMVGPDETIDLVNYDALESLTGHTRSDLEGRSVTSLFDAEDIEKSREGLREILTSTTDTETVTHELTIRRNDGEGIPCENHMAAITGPDGDLEAVAGTIRDISERKARERELERYERIVETVEDGIYAVGSDGRFTMVNDGYTELTGYSREELVGMTVSELVDEETVEKARTFEEELVAGERQTARLEADVPTAAGGSFRDEALFSLIERPDGGHERVGIVRDTTRRRRHERAIERQRERLAALNDLHDVVQTVTDAVIDQSTRREIEAVVCETIAASDSYLFAWVGEADAQSQTVQLRTEAGVEGYLDDVTISVDPDDSRSAGPTGLAIQTREIHVTGDTLEDEDYAPWREHARRLGVRSSSSIPIVHGDVLYGVLNVYADRPNAFSGAERAVIAHLGEVVGHAIAAVEQRRALTSDEVVELEFHVPNVLDAFDLPAAGDGRITFDRIVPLENDTYLQYGTVTPDMLDVLDVLGEALSHRKSVRLLDEVTTDGVIRFESRLVDPPLSSTVIALGGYVDHRVLEGSDYSVTVHLSPTADVRRVLDVVRERYPMAQLAARRQVTREPNPPVPFSRLLAETLTDRQRAALESAYFGGYFEWPRNVTGKKVADTLGVSAPTFHQHLREAERKVLQITLDDAAPV